MNFFTSMLRNPVVALCLLAFSAHSQQTGTDVVTTPWATIGTLSSNSVPWTIYTTMVSTNGTNSIFPSACYDFSRNRLLCAYIASDSHLCTNGSVHLIESSDGGLTWTNDRQLNLFPGHGIPHAGITALRDGSLLLSVLVRDQKSPGPYSYANSNFLPIHNFISLDGGLSWKTNSTIGTNFYMSASNPVFETPQGTWLRGLYDARTGTNCCLARSTDKGANWNVTPIDSAGNESCIAMHPNGTLFLLERANFYPKVFTSTNDGISWKYIGFLNLYNNGGYVYGSYPAFIFSGTRMMVASRDLPFGQAAFWYSDAYPYTNGFHLLPRNDKPSLYDAPVKLSDSCIVWLSSFSVTNTAANSSGMVPVYLEAWVTANDGEGYQKTPQSFAVPNVALFRNDLPESGFLTNWPNRSNPAVSPINIDGYGAVAMPGPVIYSSGLTNVHFGFSNVLPTLWQTNVGTILWRGGRTEPTDNHMVLDCINDSSQNVGFSLKCYGGNIYFRQANGSDGDYVSQYVGVCDKDYSGAMHLHAIKFESERLWSYLDGNLASFSPATNAIGTKAYSSVSNSSYHLSIGTFAASSSGPGSYISDVLVFTNALSDADIRAWMLRLNEGEGSRPPILQSIQNQVVIVNQTVKFTSGVFSSSDYPLTFNLGMRAPQDATDATLDPVTGVFAWTPAEDQIGTHVFDMIVTDNATLLSATQSFSITVVGTNNRPILAPIADQVITVGKTLTFISTALDPVGNSLAFSLAPGGPSNAMIEPLTGVFTWTPTPEQIGPSMLTVVASRYGAPALNTSQKFTVTVLPNTPKTRRIRLTWSTVTNEPNSGVTFQIHHTKNLAVPIGQWEVLTNFPGNIFSASFDEDLADNFFAVSATGELDALVSCHIDMEDE